jgi:hypothetical protein
MAACVLLLSSAAAAFELPQIGGIDVVGQDEKLIQFEFGSFYGIDTNVTRAPDSTKQDDSFLRILGGASLSKGSERQKFDVSLQTRADKYSDLSQHDLQETRALLGYQYDMQSVLASIRLGYAMLADPSDIALTDLVERTRLSILPNFDVRLGETMELALGYSIESTEYEDDFDHLSYDENYFAAEFRWGRRDTGRQIFLHFDSGDFDYGSGTRDNDDFSFNRIYVGIRAEAQTSSHEFALGSSNVDVATLPTSEIYATYRSTFQLNETRTLLVGLARGPEAAATAEYKLATRLFASFRHQANSRWRWSVGLGTESADLMTPDPSTPSELSRFTFDFGASAELGAPERLHGRAYTTFGYESRSGSDASFDYGRLRITLGMSLIY